MRISTGGTSMAMAGAGAYAGSKAAIEQFNNCLAKVLGSRAVTVNTLAAGVTRTNELTLVPEQTGCLIAQTPLGRLGTPNDIASAAALLVSDDAQWITGQNIRAIGGIVRDRGAFGRDYVTLPVFRSSGESLNLRS